MDPSRQQLTLEQARAERDRAHAEIERLEEKLTSLQSQIGTVRYAITRERAREAIACMIIQNQ